MDRLENLQWKMHELIDLQLYLDIFILDLIDIGCWVIFATSVLEHLRQGKYWRSFRVQFSNNAAIEYQIALERAVLGGIPSILYCDAKSLPH